MTEPSATGIETDAEKPRTESEGRRLLARIMIFLRKRISLEEDKADPAETIDEIRKGIEFRGTNIWILVFAIFIASVGLNVNSTAVVIGAMLISPLMGPIMGIGLGVGINDFELIKKAATNLGLMVIISVATSTFYFILTPLSDAQSELLARTQPTIWDVLIALFGGLAGIVAGSRKEKSNAIPGVAIATALMPPLCTAGYGLATQQWGYFFGAFYLFTINSVFISFSTLVIVRFLHYPRKKFIDKQRETRVRRWIATFVIIVTLPSLYIAFNLVKNTVFEREAGLFIREHFAFEGTQVISTNITTEGNRGKIEVVLIGGVIAPETIEDLQAQLANHPNKAMRNAELEVLQGSGADPQAMALMNQNLKTSIVEDLYKRNEEALRNKDSRIDLLESELLRIQGKELPLGDISRELMAEHKNVKEFTLFRHPVASFKDSLRLDTVTFAYIRFSRSPESEERKRLENWLKARTKADSLKIVLQSP